MHLFERQIRISIDPSLGSACARQDGNNVMAWYLSTTWLTTEIMIEPTEMGMNEYKCEHCQVVCEVFTNLRRGPD
jgi:hypothetical protein